MSNNPSSAKVRLALSAVMFFSAIAICAMTSPAHAEGDAEPAAEAAAAIDAAALWAKNCQACHGADGKAATKIGKMKKVKDLTAADVRAGFDRDRMIASVTEGMKDEAGKVLMKPYNEKLSAEEVAALIDYVIALPH